jgi:hypothetical protein
MASARDRVFATPELLEAILAQLPMQPLLLAQRVSHLLHATINYSPTLQRLLFFRADTRLRLRFNPLLQQNFPPWFISPDDHNRYSGPSYEALGKLPWTCTPERLDAFLRPEATWRTMLPFQARSTSLKIVRHCSTMMGGSVKEAVLPMPNGVTMAPLYDIAEEHLRWELVSQFHVEVVGIGGEEVVVLHLYKVVQCSYSGDDTKAETYVSRGEGKVDIHGKWLEWRETSKRKRWGMLTPVDD